MTAPEIERARDYFNQADLFAPKECRTAVADLITLAASQAAELADLRGQVAAAGFDFRAHLQRQRTFSEKAFGPSPRAKGIIEHIRSELLEIEAAPTDLSEWIDVAILALDGAWRAGHSPEQIIAGLVAKQVKNEGRVWPDWRNFSPDASIEHDRSFDRAALAPAPDEVTG